MVIQYSILSCIHFEAHRDFCCLKSAEAMVQSKPWKDWICGWQEKAHRENFSSRHHGREDGEREYRLGSPRRITVPKIIVEAGEILLSLPVFLL